MLIKLSIIEGQKCHIIKPKKSDILPYKVKINKTQNAPQIIELFENY